MPDFLPQNDDDFARAAALLARGLSGDPASYGLSAGQAAALAAAHDAWAGGWADYQTARAAHRAATAGKDQTRAALEREMRLANGVIQAAPGVTAGMKEAVGLPVRKATRTAAPVPATHPVLYRVDNEHLLQRLWFSDQATPGSKAKPAKVSLCEIRRLLVPPGGAAPASSDAMPLLALETRCPHLTVFRETDLGHTAYYALRWANTRGEAGPWGLITGYPVG